MRGVVGGESFSSFASFFSFGQLVLCEVWATLVDVTSLAGDSSSFSSSGMMAPSAVACCRAVW